MCVVVCTLCCGVVCSVGGAWCGVVRLAMRKTPSVCRLKTPPCVPGKRPHVLNMRAFSGYRRRLPERTHGGVLNLHTEGFPPSLFFLLSPLLFFSSSLLIFSCLFLSSLSCLLSLHSATMTMITRPVGHSLCTYASELLCGPECMYSGSFPVWRTCLHNARKNCLGITVQASCHLE